MEYKDEDGKCYSITYSQQLQNQDIRLKKILIGILLVGLLFLILIFVMMALIESRDHHLTYILRNLVCR